MKRFFFSSSACVYNADKQLNPHVTALAEADAVMQQLGVVERRDGEEMRAGDARPKLAHATGDAVGVVVQLRLGLKRGDMILRRAVEAFQIQLLPAGDGGEDFADALLVGVSEAVENAKRFLDAFEQQPLSG